MFPYFNTCEILLNNNINSNTIGGGGGGGGPGGPGGRGGCGCKCCCFLTFPCKRMMIPIDYIIFLRVAHKTHKLDLSGW